MQPDGRMIGDDAAAYIGLSPKTLAKYRVDGIGPPFVKLGRVYYFKEDLDAWIQARKVSTTAQARHYQRREAVPRHLQSESIDAINCKRRG